MPPELRKVRSENDKAVPAAYGKSPAYHRRLAYAAERMKLSRAKVMG